MNALTPLPRHFNSMHIYLSILIHYQACRVECLARPLPYPVSALPFTVIGLHGDRRPDHRLKARYLLQADQVVPHIREKIRKKVQIRSSADRFIPVIFAGQTSEIRST